MERLFGRDKTANDSIYNAALIKSGIEFNRTEDLLPSSMQLRSFFALHDSLSSSSLASLGYLGATATGMSEENRRNLANTIAGVTQIIGAGVTPKTGLVPNTGSIGVPRAPGLRDLEEVPPNALIIKPKDSVSSDGNGVPSYRPLDESVSPPSRPLALPSPDFNVPNGYTASKNADGTATVVGPRGGVYNSTGRYTDDGKPIYRDNSGGYVTLEGGRVDVKAPPNYDAIPLHHLCTDKCTSDANGKIAWTLEFQRFFDGSGLDVSGATENLVAVPGHRGPHPDEYHKYVYGTLNRATIGLTPNTPEYKMAVTQALNRIKIEALTRAGEVNKWLTGG